MEISVKMTVEEFQEFMDYRSDKESYSKQMDHLRRLPEFVARSLFNAMTPVEGKPGRFKIVDQEHMSDAWDMLEEFMPKKK